MEKTRKEKIEYAVRELLNEARFYMWDSKSMGFEVHTDDKEHLTEYAEGIEVSARSIDSLKDSIKLINRSNGNSLTFSII